MSVEGVKARSSWRAMYVGVLLVFSIALTACEPAVVVPIATATPTSKPAVKVRITNENINAALARVIDTGPIATLKGDTLSLKSCSAGQYISIWVRGYYVEKIACNKSSENRYSVTLTPLPAVDNPNYDWVDADNCATCHSGSSPEMNEYGEWIVDGHSRVMVDSYFWSMYMGDYSPRNPASSSGLSFRSDYPDENGKCVFCHLPTALQALQRGTDLATWDSLLIPGDTNVEKEGITCDVCHKVSDILLGENGLPSAERPGVLSLDLLRSPNSGEVFYFGPWPDHKRMIPESASGTKHLLACSPVLGESKFCAACHYGEFYDSVIYNSYGEWLESSYSKDNQAYRSCQDCHMSSSQPIGESSSAARRACSQDNLDFRNFSHNMMKRDNTGNPTMIQGAATVTIAAKKGQGQIQVEVSVVNTSAGHKFPTDSPLRHLILVVEAKDKNDKSLPLIQGPIIPEWGGSNDRPGGYEGKPGVIYGNILKAASTVPAIAYWNPTIPAWESSDTRLLPLKEERSVYSFVAPFNGKVTVTAKLLYRYAFLEIMHQKGWQKPDILVNWDEVIVE